MPTQTSEPPKIPTGRELYDAIMGHIEPELTTAQIGLLKEKYKNETPQNFMERKQRYALAMERYKEAYQGYLDTLVMQVDRYRHESFAKVELEDRTNERTTLDDISSQFSLAA